MSWNLLASIANSGSVGISSRGPRIVWLISIMCSGWWKISSGSIGAGALENCRYCGNQIALKGLMVIHSTDFRALCRVGNCRLRRSGLSVAVDREVCDDCGTYALAKFAWPDARSLFF